MPSAGGHDGGTIKTQGGGEEKTAARFTLDAAGAVTATGRTEKSILQSFYNPHRNGG
jgi:hypothetical protein